MRSTLLLVSVIPLTAAGEPEPGFIAVGHTSQGDTYLHAAPGVLAPDDALVLEDGATPWSWADYPDCMQHQWAGEDESAPRERTPEAESLWRLARGLDTPISIAAIEESAPLTDPLPSSEL